MKKYDDPIAEIRRHRDRNAHRFKTIEALVEHLSNVPTPEEWLAQYAAKKAAAKKRAAKKAPRSGRRPGVAKK